MKVFVTIFLKMPLIGQKVKTLSLKIEYPLIVNVF